MSIALYDEGISKKIKKWTEKSSAHILTPDQTSRLWEVLADESGDKPIQLPLITISRVGGYEILNGNKKRLTYDGLMLDSDGETSVNLNAIPISITYQLDVITRYLNEADAYMRNLIFNIINFPMVKVTIPYNGIEIIHDSAIRIASDVVDNSGDTAIIPGQVTRLTISVTIDDAYIWDTRIRDNISIVFDTQDE